MPYVIRVKTAVKITNEEEEFNLTKNTNNAILNMAMEGVIPEPYLIGNESEDESSKFQTSSSRDGFTSFLTEMDNQSTKIFDSQEEARVVYQALDRVMGEKRTTGTPLYTFTLVNVKQSDIGDEVDISVDDIKKNIIQKSYAAREHERTKKLPRRTRMEREGGRPWENTDEWKAMIEMLRQLNPGLDDKEIKIPAAEWRRVYRSWYNKTERAKSNQQKYNESSKGREAHRKSDALLRRQDQEGDPESSRRRYRESDQGKLTKRRNAARAKARSLFITEFINDPDNYENISSADLVSAAYYAAANTFSEEFPEGLYPKYAGRTFEDIRFGSTVKTIDDILEQ